MLPVAEPSYHRPTTRPSRRTHLHHFPTCRPSRSESKTLCHLALSSSAILLPNLPSCTDHDTYVCRERKRRYYIRASHFTPISGRGRFCPTCAGPPPSVVRSTRPDFEHHLGLQLATSSCMVSRSTWTTRATKPRHLQLADLRRIRIIRPTAPRNPAFGRVEGENGLVESPKRASEMSEDVGPCPTQNAPPSMRRHCGQGPPRDLDAQGDNAAPTVHALPRIRELQVTGFRQG